MKKMRILFCAMLAIMVMGIYRISFAGPPANPCGVGAGCPVGIPAANCSAANLTQALSGIGNSQGGILNSANIPLFVVCNIISVAGPPPDVAIQAQFPGPGASISCTYRAGTLNEPGFLAASVTINSGDNGGGPPADATRGTDSVDSENGAGTVAGMNVGLRPNQTIVCALDPGEGIVSILTLGP